MDQVLKKYSVIFLLVIPIIIPVQTIASSVFEFRRSADSNKKFDVYKIKDSKTVTAPDGKIRWIRWNDLLLKLTDGAKITLGQYKERSKQFDRGVYAFNVHSGKVLATVSKKGPEIQIKTPHSYINMANPGILVSMFPNKTRIEAIKGHGVVIPGHKKKKTKKGTRISSNQTIIADADGNLKKRPLKATTSIKIALNNLLSNINQFEINNISKDNISQKKPDVRTNKQGNEQKRGDPNFPVNNTNKLNIRVEGKKAMPNSYKTVYVKYDGEDGTKAKINTGSDNIISLPPEKQEISENGRALFTVKINDQAPSRQYPVHVSIEDGAGTVQASDTAALFVGGNPRMDVSLQKSAQYVRPGGVLDYTLRATNKGNTEINAQFGHNGRPNEIETNVDPAKLTLAPGQTDTATVQVKVPDLWPYSGSIGGKINVITNGYSNGEKFNTLRTSKRFTVFRGGSSVSPNLYSTLTHDVSLVHNNGNSKNDEYSELDWATSGMIADNTFFSFSDNKSVGNSRSGTGQQADVSLEHPNWFINHGDVFIDGVSSQGDGDHAGIRKDDYGVEVYQIDGIDNTTGQNGVYGYWGERERRKDDNDYRLRSWYNKHDGDTFSRKTRFIWDYRSQSDTFAWSLGLGGRYWNNIDNDQDAVQPGLFYNQRWDHAKQTGNISLDINDINQENNQNNNGRLVGGWDYSMPIGKISTSGDYEYFGKNWLDNNGDDTKHEYDFDINYEHTVFWNIASNARIVRGERFGSATTDRVRNTGRYNLSYTDSLSILGSNGEVKLSPGYQWRQIDRADSPVMQNTSFFYEARFNNKWNGFYAPYGNLNITNNIRRRDPVQKINSFNDPPSIRGDLLFNYEHNSADFAIDAGVDYFNEDGQGEQGGVDVQANYQKKTGRHQFHFRTSYFKDLITDNGNESTRISGRYKYSFTAQSSFKLDGNYNADDGSYDIQAGVNYNFETPVYWNPVRGNHSGRLFLDENQNGKYDDGEPGLAKAQVTIGNKSTVTDTNGRYVVKGLEPGEYEVEYDAPAENKPAIETAVPDKVSITAGETTKSIIGITNYSSLTINLDYAQTEMARMLNLSSRGKTVAVSINGNGQDKARAINVGGSTLIYLRPGQYTIEIDDSYLGENHSLKPKNEQTVTVIEGREANVTFTWEQDAPENAVQDLD